MKLKSSAICLIIVFLVMISCREQRQDPTRVQNANESINESKENAMDREEEWQGERRDANDTASYENRQGYPSESASDSDTLVR